MAYSLTSITGVVVATNTASTFGPIGPYTTLRVKTDIDLLVALNVDPDADSFHMDASSISIFQLTPTDVFHFAAATSGETGNVRLAALAETSLSGSEIASFNGISESGGSVGVSGGSSDTTTNAVITGSDNPNLSPPTTVNGGATWTSGVFPTGGAESLAVAATLSQTGVLSLQRYIDEAGTIAIGAAITQAMVAGTPATAAVNDGLPAASYKVSIQNTSGSVGTISNFAMVRNNFFASNGNGVGGSDNPSFSPPATLSGSTTWTSAPFPTNGAEGIGIGATLSQTGVLSVQRYIDVAATIAVGPPITQAMTANTPATVAVNDGLPAASYTASIQNTSVSTASISNFGVVRTNFGGSLSQTSGADNPNISPPATVIGGATWTSSILLTGGAAGLAVGAKLSQTGVLSIQRYIDVAGTIAIGTAVTQAMTANVSATVAANDGLPCASYTVSVQNTSGSLGNLTLVGVVRNNSDNSVENPSGSFPTTVGSSSTWTSAALPGNGFQGLGVGVTLNQNGNLTVQRYVDTSAVIAIGTAITQAITANTPATIAVNDGLPCGSYKISVQNTSGSSGNVTNAAIVRNF